MFEDTNLSLNPLNFFRIRLECHQHTGPFPKKWEKVKGFILPRTTDLSNEESFAEVAMGWGQAGLAFFIKVNAPVSKVVYPDLQKGDSVELFIDTRDVKTSGFNTRFCHHFFFLPESVGGIQGGETTHFRTEDAHELSNPKELSVETTALSHSYLLNIFIPASALHGYDPVQFDRLGFSYRINRAGGEPQHFSALTEEYAIEQQPSLWASVGLVS